MKKSISLTERVDWKAKSDEASQPESFDEVRPIGVPLPEGEPMLTIEALQARAESNTKVLEDILRFKLSCPTSDQPNQVA